MEINKIYHGDCLELMPQIASGSIDMILCDLPYGTTACKWDTIIPFDKLWEQYKRIIKENGVIALFGSEPFSSHLRISNIENYKYDLYWNKNQPSGALLAKKQPMRAVETISIFYKKQPLYIPKMTQRTDEELKRFSKKSVNSTSTEIDGRAYSYTRDRENGKLKYPNNILIYDCVFNRSKIKTKHPTQKPVPLFEYLINTYTKENEIILDNCIGSGTTAIACINTNRNYIGIEKERKYFDIAEKRISAAKNQIKLFEGLF